MPVLMISYQVADDGATEVTSAIEKAFAAVEAQRPDGVRYSYLRRADSGEFLALLQLDDGIENPLPGIEAARELQATVARWATGPAPVPQLVEVLGDYRMLGQQNE
jgi:hypothetical protein